MAFVFCLVSCGPKLKISMKKNVANNFYAALIMFYLFPLKVRRCSIFIIISMCDFADPTTAS